jgi:diguanylate cyclase (GGDEF)-like protein
MPPVPTDQRDTVVLHVEDSDEFAALTEALLAEAGYSVHRTATLDDAEDIARHETFACAFVDLELPDAGGLEAIMGLRSASPALPLVVLSGQDTDTAPVKAMLLGAQDWLRKHEITAGRLKDAAALAIARQDAQTKAIWVAAHDGVTGLPNRALALEHLTRALARASRRPTHVAVLFCDLDRFKTVNDTHGHATGDVVLRHVAHRLVSTVRPGDVAARWGGDEFVVIAEGLTSPEQASQIAVRIRGMVSEPITVQAVEHHVDISIGIGVTPGTTTPSELVTAADHAMLTAKRTNTGLHLDPDAP